MARKASNDTVQLKLRFSEGLRRLLERAAARSGRSLNREITLRLGMSFSKQGVLTEEDFGGKEVFELMKVVAATVNAAAGGDNAGRRLLDDPLRYARAVDAVKGVLDSLRPAPTQEVFDLIGERMVADASRIIRENEAKAKPVSDKARVGEGDK